MGTLQAEKKIIFFYYKVLYCPPFRLYVVQGKLLYLMSQQKDKKKIKLLLFLLWPDSIR